jgi:hypothetical protein
LGADRVLVIGLRYPRTPEEEDRLARRRETNFSSPTYLVGKALNALLLDRIEYDVDRLRLFNAILASGVQTYGREFLEKINEPIIAQRNTPYRIVRDFFLRPSKDLGMLAGECMRHQPRSSGVRDCSAAMSRATPRAARSARPTCSRSPKYELPATLSTVSDGLSSAPPPCVLENCGGTTAF